MESNITSEDAEGTSKAWPRLAGVSPETKSDSVRNATACITLTAFKGNLSRIGSVQYNCKSVTVKAGVILTLEAYHQNEL